jgi:putative ABC transport system permease protein
VIRGQLNFLENQQLGFNKDRQIVLPLQDQHAEANYAALKNELLKNPAVKTVTSGSTYPGIVNVEDVLFYAEGKTINDLVDVRTACVENDYFETLGLTLLKGRGFTREFTGDSNHVVLNEAAIKELGYDPANAVGRKVYYDFQGKHNTMQIVGVVRDFNFESLYNPIRPFAFSVNTFLGNKYSYVIANVASDNYSAMIKDLEHSWHRINPDLPFVYSFLDRDFQQNYEKDQRASGIVGYFTLISILIACLGLFGLAAFSAEQRTREIGIRKVLGASVGNIAGLLSRDFIRLVVIAVLVASPLAWYGMNRWLQHFAYKVTISWWMFVLAAGVALIIALGTVGFQAVRAAVANPVKSLRSE